MVFVQGSHKLHQQPPELPPPPQLLRVGSTLSTWAMLRWSLLTPCPAVSSSGRTWLGGGDVLWMGVAAWRFVSLLPLIPQLIPSHPHGAQPHPSLHCGTSSSHTPGWAVEKGSDPEGVVGFGLVWSPRCVEGAPTPQPARGAHPSFKDVWAEQNPAALQGPH